MKLKQKMFIGFIAVSLLVGVVGFLGLYNDNKIVSSFESGDEHFGPIIEASGEVSSYAKRAEGHALLFLTLHNESDRQKFYMRIASLREQNSIINARVRNPQARKILDDIKYQTDELQSIGESLFQAYDYETYTTGNFEAKNHEELIQKLDNAAAEIRNDGLELAKIEVAMKTEQEQIAKRNASYLYNMSLIIILLAVFMALVLGYIFSKNIVDPVIKLKEKAIEIGKGNLGARIGVTSKDEIGELARAFNGMASDLQKSNDEIVSAKEYTENIVRSMSDTLIAVSPQGTIQIVNPAACMLLGFRDNELIGQPVEKVFPDNSSVLERQVVDNSTKEQLVQNVEKNYLTKDKKNIPVIFSASAMYDKSGNILGTIYVARDITDRKQADQKIQEQAALLDKARDAIGVWDLKQNLLYWNKGAEQLYGWTAEEIVGKNIDELLYKDEQTKHDEAKKSVLEKGEWSGELYQLTKENKKISIESRWTLVCDNAGKPKSILVINTDITEKKKLESQLFRAQRMESIGTLANGIAHDINNVLLPIILSLQLLHEKFTDDGSQKLIGILERSAHRGANLVKQVQSFVNGIEGERKTLQIIPLMSEIRQIANETFPRNIEVQTNASKDLWAIYGDATQMHQVLMNLCVNARDAMPDGGILGLSAENQFIEENYARMNIEARVGPYVLISISDTGTGIPAKFIDSIFDPFFTTKPPGKGTGLGLSIAHGIVKSHGGFITLYSEVEKGTTFKVYLPASMEHDKESTELHQDEFPAGNGEYILIVDDEEQIRDVTSAILRKYWYNVLTAENGKEAIQLYMKHKEEIKVVLMDMMMPVMDGQTSIKELLKLNPEVKIIAVSGLTEKEKLIKIEDMHINAFLPKPYTAEKLLDSIHKAIS